MKTRPAMPVMPFEAAFLTRNSGAQQSGFRTGKHASFLDPEACHGGCGGDNCGAMQPLKISELINLGEQKCADERGFLD